MSKQLTKPQQLWVDALRSGQYQQSKHILHDNTGYCCLGVACAVAEQHGVSVERSNEYIFGTSLRNQPDVQEWLGLRTTYGALGDDDTDSLMFQNDGLSRTFAEIADVIEASADTLFKD